MDNKNFEIKLDKNIIDKMIECAFASRKNAYAPYSNYKVGACILAKNTIVDNPFDTITADSESYCLIGGCNIENAAYSPGNCAERTAIFKAVSCGLKEFCAIAIVAGKDDTVHDYVSPCGVCRQVLREFVNPESFAVIMAKSKDDYKVMSLEQLLPLSFGPENLM